MNRATKNFTNYTSSNITLTSSTQVVTSTFLRLGSCFRPFAVNHQSSSLPATRQPQTLCLLHNDNSLRQTPRRHRQFVPPFSTKSNSLRTRALSISPTRAFQHLLRALYLNTKDEPKNNNRNLRITPSHTTWK
ncbi:hypothetical protein PIB30_056309 [Stylosanthes scabra]|uniref:Uncharacterized protein n=1 Tax=Stylosanthes scabra TaxID=79078 RepID=A0ABU6QJS3_9FABA|nr:hypothetical protein [Stylosanthes scabra]